jgi:hypothetical protein
MPYLWVMFSTVLGRARLQPGRQYRTIRVGFQPLRDPAKEPNSFLLALIASSSRKVRRIVYHLTFW